MKTISVIIPIEDESIDIPSLDFLKKVDYPQENFEIILKTGRWPSIQRNEAVKEAKGEILYFCNRDSRVEPDIFKKIVEKMDKDEKIAGVGGPDLTPPNNNYIQHLFGYAMGSYFAHWKMRARYAEIGKERVSDEKELLLSNLAIRKDIFLKANGFSNRLYPNEENELINRIIKIGYKFIYSPEIKIYRDRRKTLLGFIKQFYRYGQGRMKQIFIEGFSRNLIFFIPVFYSIYLAILPIARNVRFIFAPLYLYIILAIIDSLYLSFKYKRFLVLWLPSLYLIMHISYAIGMLACIYNYFIFR